MLGKRIINSNDAGGACTTNTNDYPTTNLAYYKMSTAADEKDTYNGAATDVNFNVQGKFGNAAEFNGTSSRILLPSNLISGTTDSDYSVSMWVKFNTLPTSNFISLIGSNSNISVFRLLLYYNSGSTYNVGVLRTFGGSYYYNSANTGIQATLSTGQYYNIIVTYQSSNKLVNGYLNGNPIGSYTLNQTGELTASAPVLGAYNSTGDFSLNGSIDQVRIFSSALNATQVESLYNEVYCVPTIVPTDHFNTVLYTGTAPTTKVVTSVGFQPDFVWVKSRSTADHNVVDSVRGLGSNTLKALSTSTTDAENTTTSNNILSLDSDGFTIQGSGSRTNSPGQGYVAWNWKAGGGDLPNNNGTITSQVSANVDAGFSIVEYSGNSTTASVGHGLSIAPELILFKCTNVAATDWLALTTTIDGSADYLTLNSTSAKNDLANGWLPDSTTINFASSSSLINLTGRNCIAYAFHSVDGFSKIGSYKGNGSTTGPTIVTGFRPAWIMFKPTSATGYWYILDDKRSTTNPRNEGLFPNDDLNEITNTSYNVDFNSNGFQLKNNTIGFNQSGQTYIFMAFAE